MKKIISKLSAMLILAFSVLIIPVMNIEAADGTMQISDGSAPIGEIVTVTVTVEAGGAEIGDCETTLSYDTELLEFVEGTDTTLIQDGSIFLAQYGTGTETEFTFELQFRVLAEGSSSLTLEDSTAYLYSDETLYLQATGGTISSGEAVVGNPIQIDGITYNFYENFTDAMVLDGFTKSTLDYDGYTHNVIVQDISGKTAAYLAKDGSDPVLAIYNENSATFELTEIVYISTDAYLLLLPNSNGSQCPEGFAETTLEMNGKIFSAWQNMNEKDYFLVYALSNAGNEGFYQYDSVEGTYQRYSADTVVADIIESEESKTDDTFIGKLKKVISDNLIYCLGAVGIVILVLLIVIIVMSAVLGKRNSELDDLYDELESKDGKNNLTVRNKKAKVQEETSDYDDDEYEYSEDDFDDEIEYEYEDDESEYEDDFEYDEDEAEYDEDDFDDELEYDEDDYDEDEIEYEYEEPVKPLAKKKKKISRETSEYSVDFIDL